MNSTGATYLRNRGQQLLVRGAAPPVAEKMDRRTPVGLSVASTP